MDRFLKSRRTAAAGSFYPATPQELMDSLRRCFAASPTAPEGDPPFRLRLKALVVPHAGYVYSGAVAAGAYRKVEDWHALPRIHLWGPAHRVPFSGVAGGPYGTWETPLGPVEADCGALEALEDLRRIRNWELPHREEHSLEVQLPFFRYLGFCGTLVPLLFGDTDPLQEAEDLNEVLRPEDLIIVSTDLSHFHPYAEAVRRDRSLLEAAVNLDAERVLRGEACGRLPLAALLFMAQARGWQPELLDYRNSGDTSGDRSRVVGYGALAFWEGENDC